MMKNKETLKAAMDRRLSFLDERPSCRAALQQRIAQEEAPVMKKKLSLALACALVLVSLSVIALAAGILFSPKADAVALADRALEEKYGISPKMQTWFTRQEKDLPGGAVRVTYSAEGEFAWVLGTYTADVKNGKAEITWSRDGSDTSGGYEADAWGAAQLKQMLKDNQETGDMSRFSAYALRAVEQAGVTEPQAFMSEKEAEAYFENLELEKSAALNARVLSEAEMQAVAKEAVVQRYDLTEAQAAMLELYVQPLASEENAWYWMIGGQPCFEVQYFLDQDPDHPGSFTEKDGAYAVAVNVKTGVVERLVYESGLGGEG